MGVVNFFFSNQIPSSHGSSCFQINPTCVHSNQISFSSFLSFDLSFCRDPLQVHVLCFLYKIHNYFSITFAHFLQKIELKFASFQESDYLAVVDFTFNNFLSFWSSLRKNSPNAFLSFCRDPFQVICFVSYIRFMTVSLSLPLTFFRKLNSKFGSFQ